MSNKNRVASAFLRALADAIDELHERELDALLRGARIDTLIKSSAKNQRATSSDDPSVSQQAEVLMSNLTQASSRNEARNYLRMMKPSRRILVRLAQGRDVHVIKEDTIAVLIEKLVENVVGSRLDSAAIRNG